MYPEPDWLFKGHQGFTDEGGIAPLQIGRDDISSYIRRPVFTGVIRRQKLDPKVAFDPGPGTPGSPNGPPRQLGFAEVLVGYQQQLKHPDGSTQLYLESWPTEQPDYDPESDGGDLTEQIGVFRQVNFAAHLLVAQPGNPIIPVAQGAEGGPRVNHSDWYTRNAQTAEDDSAYLHTAIRGEAGRPAEPFPVGETLYATYWYMWVQPFPGAAYLFVNGNSPDTWYGGSPASEWTSFACNIYEVIGNPSSAETPPPVPFVSPATQGQGVVRRYPVRREAPYTSL